MKKKCQKNRPDYPTDALTITMTYLQLETRIMYTEKKFQ